MGIECHRHRLDIANSGSPHRRPAFPSSYFLSPKLRPCPYYSSIVHTMPCLALRHCPLRNPAFDRDTTPSTPTTRAPRSSNFFLQFLVINTYSSTASRYRRYRGSFSSLPHCTAVFPLPFYLSFLRLDSSLSSLPYVFVRLLLDLMPPGGTCALSEPKCQCMDTMPHDRLECGTSRLHPLREPFYGLSPLLFRLHSGFLMLVGVLESTRVESRLRTFVHLSALPLLSRVFSPWLICFRQSPLACSSLSLSSASQLPLHVLCHPSPLWSPSYRRRTPIEPLLYSCHHTASVLQSSSYLSTGPL